MLTATFRALGTATTVVTAAGSQLTLAAAAAEAELARIDAACSRFREDSELSAHNRGAGGPPREVSALLEEAVTVALEAAAATGGAVDPTVGRSLEALGYTTTFRALDLDLRDVAVTALPAPGWSVVELDPAAHTLRLGAGVSLDLGATGKAWAADRAAAAAAAACGAGVAVDCGGDVAVAGEPPPGGWPVRVAESRDSGAFEDVSIFDGGMATSGTGLRRWRRGGDLLHHILDPRTGRPADGRWRTVTVAAASCADANTAATAAIVMGGDAVGWLRRLGLPARLVDGGGGVTVTGGWPAAC